MLGWAVEKKVIRLDKIVLDGVSEFAHAVCLPYRQRIRLRNRS